MRPPDPERKALRRASILAHARRLFARQGYDRVSMDAIAAACGVTKPVLYSHFENKDALLLATLRAHWSEQAAALTSFHAAADLAQTLAALARLVLRYARRPETQDVIRIVLAETGRRPEIAADFFQIFGPLFAKRLLRPIRPHLHRRYSDRQALALFHQFVGSLAHYSLMRQLFRPGRRYLPDERLYVTLLVDSFLRATRPASPRSAPR